MCKDLQSCEDQCGFEIVVQGLNLVLLEYVTDFVYTTWHCAHAHNAMWFVKCSGRLRADEARQCIRRLATVVTAT